MALYTPSGETFDVNVVGNATGQTWAGSFTVKPLLSWRDGLAQDKLRRELLGADAQNASPDAVAMAVILSELSVRVIDAPAWWKESKGGLDLPDDEVITTIYSKMREIIDAKVAETAKDAEEARAEIKAVKAEQEAPRKVNKKVLPPAE
jgi:hypothetical protein